MTQPAHAEPRTFASFHEFYPFYLGEHRNAACRRLHVIGSGLVLIVVATAVVTRDPWLLLMPVVGYGFAWVGHFAFDGASCFRKAQSFDLPRQISMGGSVYWVRALSRRSRAFIWMGGSGQTRYTGAMIQQAPYDTSEIQSFTWLQK